MYMVDDLLIKVYEQSRRLRFLISGIVFQLRLQLCITI